MLNLLTIITSGSSFFLAFLVLTTLGNTNLVANRWLGFFLVLLSIVLIDDSLLILGVYKEMPELIGFCSLPYFALAPTLYIVVTTLVSAGKKPQKQYIWHFFPFFIFFLLDLPFLLSPNFMKIKELESSITMADRIALGLIILHIAIYWFLSLRKLWKHQKDLEKITASPEDVRLDWLLYFVYAIGFTVLVWIFDIYVFPTQKLVGWFTPFYFLCIYALGYFAMKQKEVYPLTEAQAREVDDFLKEGPKPAPTGIKEEAPRMKDLKNHLLQVMEQEKLYLNPALNLPMLAESLQLSVHETSELINAGFGENFAQFVNKYRVEESKRLLLSEKHDHLSIIGIAFEAGFNSKTSFNTAFKKITHLSPSEFRSKSKALS